MKNITQVLVYFLLVMAAIAAQSCGKSSGAASSSQSGAFASSLQFQQPAAIKN